MMRSSSFSLLASCLPVIDIWSTVKSVSLLIVILSVIIALPVHEVPITLLVILPMFMSRVSNWFIIFLWDGVIDEIRTRKTSDHSRVGLPFSYYHILRHLVH